MNTVLESQSAIHPASTQTHQLQRYDEMCRAIAECQRVDEAKDIRDKSEALRAVARIARNRQLEVQFAEIKVRAEIKCGELLTVMAANGLRDQGNGGDRKSQYRDDTVTLAEIGLSKLESSRYQQAAKAPRLQVEQAFATARATNVPVTSAQIRALAKPSKSHVATETASQNQSEEQLSKPTAEEPVKISKARIARAKEKVLLNYAAFKAKELEAWRMQKKLQQDHDAAVRCEPESRREEWRQVGGMHVQARNLAEQIVADGIVFANGANPDLHLVLAFAAELATLQMAALLKSKEDGALLHAALHLIELWQEEVKSVASKIYAEAVAKRDDLKS